MDFYPIADLILRNGMLIFAKITLSNIVLLVDDKI